MSGGDKGDASIGGLLKVVDTVTVASLLYTAVTLAGSYWIGHSSVLRPRKPSRVDKLVLTWLVWDIVIHTTLEGPFVVLSLLGTIKDSSSFLALVWKEYGKADARWLVSDPTVVSLEILTVFAVTPLCVLLIYAICKRKPYRHWLQLVLCTAELYGGWMTFVPEFLIGSPNLAYENPLHLYVYLIFFNGVWVVIPALLMYQSWVELSSKQATGGASVTTGARKNK